jgi:hypothetical protein
LKYCKHKEDKEVSDAYQFLDRHGKEIHGCIEWDSETSYATVYELADLNDPRSTVIIRQKYFPQVRVIIDGVSNPDDTQLKNIREKKISKRGKEG